MAAIPNIPLVCMNNEENQPRKQEKENERRNPEKKMVEPLPIGLRILHGNIKCSFRRGIMVKIAFQNNPAKNDWS